MTSPRPAPPVPSESRTLGILLISAGHARAHYAFVLATAAGALGRDVVLFATNEGVHALRSELSGVSGVKEGEAGLRSKGVGTLAELKQAAAELGIRQIACEAGLLVTEVDQKALDPSVEVAGVATFLAAVGDGQIVTV
jgi:peroxiredoxin family protein